MQRVPLRLTNVALVQNRNLFLVSVASMLQQRPDALNLHDGRMWLDGVDQPLSHQQALTTQEIAHREAYPHVREARANIASRRAAAAATQHQQQQQQQQQQRVTTIPPPEWKIRPDPGTRDTSESNKERWDVPEYTPPTADFTPARGILQNHNSGLPPSRRDDATARPPSAAQTATQQATRERAQQPAGL